MKVLAALVIVAAIICLAVAVGAIAWWLGFAVAAAALGGFGFFGIGVDE